MAPHVELMKGMMAALGLDGQPLKRLVIEIDIMDGAHFYAKGRIKDTDRIASLVQVVEDVAVSPNGVVSLTPSVEDAAREAQMAALNHDILVTLREIAERERSR